MSIPLSKCFLPCWVIDYFCQPRKWSVESGLTLYALFLQPQSCHVTKVWFQQRRRVHGTVTKEVLARRDRDCAQTFRAALTHQRKSVIESHRRNSLSARRPHITGDKWWPHADRRFDAAFQLRQPKGSKVNLFFLPWPFLSSFCHVLWFSRCNEKQSSNEGRRRKDYIYEKSWIDADTLIFFLFRFFPGLLHMGYPISNGTVYPWLESVMGTK